MQELERITARQGELDALAEELTKQMQEVQAEREELVIAERVLNRPAEQDRAAAEAAAAVVPAPARVAGRAVLLIQHRGENPNEAALPADYRRVLAIVRADDPVTGKLEPLRAKMTKLADRGRLHKRPDGRFTARR